MGLGRAAKSVGRFISRNFDDLFRISLALVAATALAYGVDISPAIQASLAAVAVQRGLTAPEQVEELLSSYVQAKVMPHGNLDPMRNVLNLRNTSTFRRYYPEQYYDVSGGRGMRGVDGTGAPGFYYSFKDKKYKRSKFASPIGKTSRRSGTPGFESSVQFASPGAFDMRNFSGLSRPISSVDETRRDVYFGSNEIGIQTSFDVEPNLQYVEYENDEAYLPPDVIPVQNPFVDNDFVDLVDGLNSNVDVFSSPIESLTPYVNTVDSRDLSARLDSLMSETRRIRDRTSDLRRRRMPTSVIANIIGQGDDYSQEPFSPVNLDGPVGLMSPPIDFAYEGYSGDTPADFDYPLYLGNDPHREV